jgi:hypothetical protein
LATRFIATIAAGMIVDTENSTRNTSLGSRTITLSGLFEYTAVKTLMTEQSNHIATAKNPKWVRIPCTLQIVEGSAQEDIISSWLQ